MDDKAIGRVLRDIYDRLLDRYGPQHWWPADEPFEVIIGAILTQSTAWSNVEKAITNLKNKGKLSPTGIRQLPHDELAATIRSSGYYNVKAKKLQAFTGWLGKQYNDDLEKLFSVATEKLREQLLSIYGIGEETADSVILYAANKPVFVIDAYTRRIAERTGIIRSNAKYSTLQKLFTDNLPPDTKMFNEYHALLVRLAKESCRKNPACTECCLNLSGQDTSNKEYPCSHLVR